MNIHAHDASEQRKPPLVVFVHGFMGSGYGTWKAFPKLLFDEASITLDVAVFQYESGYKRIRFGKTPPPRVLENRLADELADSGYKSIILLGHSMGGLIAAGSIKRIFERNLENQERFTFSLFLMASPRAGSRWAVRVASMFSDIRYLSRHADHLGETEEFLVSRVSRDIRFGSHDNRPLVPTFAVSADGDRVVDEFSSTFSIPSEQKRGIKGSHTSIVKPENHTWAIYEWTLARIHDALMSADSRPPKQRKGLGPDDIVVSFQCHSTQGTLRDDYDVAVRDFMLGSTGCNLLDATYYPEARTELAIRVLRAHDHEDDAVRQSLLRDAAFQESRQILHLGIAPYVESGDDPSSEIAKLVGDPPRGALRWVEACSSRERLHNLILTWLGRVYNARRANAYYSSDSLARGEAMLRYDGGLGSPGASS